MGRSGFEPETNRLKAEYSTIELATRLSSQRKVLFSKENQSFTRLASLTRI